MTALATAIAFLTRVPVPASGDVRRAVAWFPIVGALVGAAVGGAYAGLWELVPSTVAAADAVLLGVLVTGAFHEDGLADVADAFAGGWTRDDRLRILDDPRHGSYGVAALAGSILLRVVALASLGPAAGFAGSVAAHTLGRASAVAAMLRAPTAKRDGLGAAVGGSAGAATDGATFDGDATPAAGPRAERVVGIVAGVALAVLALGWWAAIALGLAVVGTGAVVWLAIRKIGGVSGDVLGTIEQVVECLVLIAVTALAARHPLWWR